MVEEGLKTELENVSGLSGKVFPVNAPPGQAAPYIVYLQESGSEYETLDGWTGLTKASYELNIMHSTYKSMKQLAALVTAKLKTLQGAILSGITVQSISIGENSPEGYEEQIKLYRKIINITIMY